MSKRRSFAAALAAALLLAAASCATGPSAPSASLVAGSPVWTGQPVVLTSGGAVRGYEDPDLSLAWRGIPYAKPPVGELRWKAPREPESWSGIREARRFGSACTQYRPLLGGITGSEDCLYLNVWRPRSTEVELPVYVWIHGGGNSIGAADMVSDYYGNRLASISRMVFVSVNYRLGPLGWFRHPALAEGEPEDGSGNYGTLDLIQALRWVRANARAFGGNPDRVIIAGESAGAMNVMSLLISPEAKGLFSHALVESGAATSHTPEEAERSSDRVLRTLLYRDRKARSLEQADEVARAMSPQEIRSYLRSKSDRQLLRCFTAGPTGMIGNPAILRDGVVLPPEGFRVLDGTGYVADVPLMIGSNKDETKLFLFLDGALWRQRELFGAVARWGSDGWKAEGVDGVARRLASRAGAQPVYAYHFHWGARGEDGKSPLPGSWGERLGSFHSLDIPFFLGTDTVEGKLLGGVLFTRANQAGRKALSAAMMRYVASFVGTGDPNAENPDLPRWDPWRNGEIAPKSIIFDARGDYPWIRMSQVELTRSGVEETMRREIKPELYGKAAAYIERGRASLVAD